MKLFPSSVWAQRGLRGDVGWDCALSQLWSRDACTMEIRLVEN